MQILSLGSSIGTQAYPDGKLTAQALVVKTFEELEEKKAQVRDGWSGQVEGGEVRRGKA